MIHAKITNWAITGLKLLQEEAQSSAAFTGKTKKQKKNETDNNTMRLKKALGALSGGTMWEW